MLNATEDKNYVATLLLFHIAFWNLKTRRIAVDACGNGKWQLSFKDRNVAISGSVLSQM
jgi:hypothetical protein